MRRPEVLIAVPLLLLVAWGVWAQVRPRSAPRGFDPASLTTLAVGEALDPGLVFQDVGGRSHRLGTLYGSRATVLTAWSTTCPCVPELAPRMRALRERFGLATGVRWIGLAGEPDDAAEDLVSLRDELGDLDVLLLDPAQRACRRLGFSQATVVAVLDADGYVRYRGSPTDDLYAPEEDYLEEALAAIVAGRTPAVPDREPTYGCAFSAPAEDCPDVPPPAAPDAGAP